MLCQNVRSSASHLRNSQVHKAATYCMVRGPNMTEGRKYSLLKRRTSRVRNYTENSPPSEAVSRSPGQEIPDFYKI